MEEEFDDLKIRRRKLIEASKTPRTKEEIEKILKPYKTRNIDILVDDRECTITHHFEALVGDNNKQQRRVEATYAVSGNLFRPLDDFLHDMKWLLAQVGTVREAQKGIIGRR